MNSLPVRTPRTHALGGVTTTVLGFALICLSLAPATSAASPDARYAAWTIDGSTTPKSGTMNLTFGSPASTILANFTTSGTATDALELRTNAWLTEATPFGQQYGTSQVNATTGVPFASIKPNSSSVASTTTYSFTAPTPIGTWSFAIGDINGDEVVTISATDSTNAVITDFNGWLTQGGVFNFCNVPASERPTSCGGSAPTTTPAWDGTASLTAPAGSTNTRGLAAWFTPTQSLNSLTFTFSSTSALSRYQTWFAGEPSTAPDFATPPANRTVTVGDSASFVVFATGTRPLNYQWQISLDDGATWSNIAGATSATYTIASSSLSQNGTLYRAIATNPVRSETSASARLTVNPIPEPPPPPPPPPPDPEPSPTPTPTPSPTPTPTPSPSVDAPFANETIQNLPAGQAVAYEGAQPVTVAVVPKPPERTQTVQGENWSLDLAARQPDGRPAPLTPDGAIDATSGGSVLVSGTGFAPGSVINVFLIDPSQSLATLTVGADGTFSGSVPVPAGLAPGRYVVQANGTTPSAQVRSTSVGVLIGAPISARRGVLRTTVYFDVRSAVLDTKALRKIARLAGRVPEGAQIVRVRSVGYVQPESFTGNDQRLSTKRARNVVRQLRKDGVRGPTVIRGNGQAKQSGDKARRATVTYRVVN